ncbi:hypothetical protein MAR_015920 [Mya arenaria]|uniref:Uncharacterized protein n=1 Tax=Mya arenaria TaxID=6604 RepID=A0ABY7FLZ6_MYAAR|nr:hypothetical protein MAR_015920 [Mya arenaria]
MPANLNTKSLKQFCLRKIALCFDSFWMKSFNEQFKDVPRILYVIGPFDHMTNETVQDLINSLIDVNRLKAVHFQLLLQESVVRLDLSKAPKPAVSDSVLKVIALRCPMMKGSRAFKKTDYAMGI